MALHVLFHRCDFTRNNSSVPMADTCPVPSLLTRRWNRLAKCTCWTRNTRTRRRGASRRRFGECSILIVRLTMPRADVVVCVLVLHPFGGL